jgi:predicted Zn finger-like uncharacterized protein
MMNGTTRCPHCETRFKIAEAQFSAHQGRVRCGHCSQAFDARPNFIADQPSPQLDQPIHTEADIEQIAENSESEALFDIETSETPAEPEPFPEQDVSEEVAETHLEPDESTNASIAQITPSEHETTVATEILCTGNLYDVHETVAIEHDDTLDFSHIAEQKPRAIDQPTVFAETTPDEDESILPSPNKHRIWPWIIGIVVSILLLTAQSAYFFRIGLAAHLPALKPALIGYCHFLNCSVPLPENTELISIESSSLDADPAQENQVNLNALLRNRASYTLAYPVIALTLNDNQDKALARRLFTPADYLPTDEKMANGILTNHEVSVKLRLQTNDLRPAGYRLELFYPKP